MAKTTKWKHISAKVNPKNNVYNQFYKSFRHLGTLDTVQVLVEITIPPAFESPIEDYVAEIRKKSEGLIDPWITQSSYVQEEDGYDPYSEPEASICGWRAELTEPEKETVKEYFEANSIG